ncbi:hypothetical protein [Conexibacter sp. SYSU D00693]|uniref:hypothetical protein n=1 Tax=Conexibacter sp. SYSU D00693 TaxID=2812560 RepID=UPI00196B7BD8|nr:hypothetical protein [Conexibacter sp. SYSU D00693]
MDLDRLAARREAHDRQRRSLRREQELRARRRAQRVGLVGFLAAAALPVVLWHHVIAMIASEFELEWRYLLTGWTPWALMALGMLCFVRVWMLDRRARGSRFHVVGGGAWFGWGVTLYLLGFALATQVAQIATSLHGA